MNPDKSHVTRLKAVRAVGQNPARWDMPPKHEGCGKRRCSSLGQAISYALHMTTQCGHPLRVYACDACSGWHVTKTKAWKDPGP